MEYFWYIAASIAAGVGTGLAGLSAATVMVPILIVLCPSFAGESGAYHATAIALASDILGSAVTAGIYIKHKNIDLRRGWLMMSCILSMCIVGSFVAFSVGSVVLGSFSLFLTFFIGIRFLIKPDSSHNEDPTARAGLDPKGVLISLFFGLTIGFGTGFVGSGGGMMMLLVFTAFLGMNLKSAVGTSTFIMTFTALIAAVSHILIDPSIFFERWDVLLICIVSATVSSLISAQFANRVKNRTVGLATGALLTVLGATMLLMHYWDTLSAVPMVLQVLKCLVEFLEYILAGAVILIVLRFTCKKLPSYVFRKLLHLVAFTSVMEVILVAETWYAAVNTVLLFTAIVYPVLWVLEGCDWYSRLFVQKKRGEIKKSMVLLFVTAALVIAFAWGLLGKEYIAIATTLMWGCGDAVAALVGIPYGKHKIQWRFADGEKTCEGSIAMLLATFGVGFVCLLLTSGQAWYWCLFSSAITAPICTFTELVSKEGMDTVTVPLVISGVLFLLML